ncbi:MAG: hypothetical protein C0602_13425 [Denitrovibrio sp.]|nr:MAG: hypothetical protein C0602_13425 [Denitrovibrio sp.]
MTQSVQRLLEKHSSEYDNISVHISLSKSKSVQLDGTAIESVDYSDSASTIVRCVKDGKMLTYALTGTDEDSLKAFFAGAAKAISYLPSDVNRFIPSYSLPEKSADYFDKNFDDISMEMLTTKAVEVTETALENDKRVKSVKQSSVAASKSTSVIISTAGPVLKAEKTVFSAGAYLIAEDNGEERDGYDYVSSVKMKGLDYKTSAKTAAMNACSLLGARQIKSGKYHIVFSASVMADFIELLLDLTDGENVFKGVSLLGGKKGQKIASEGFYLTDNPLVPDGIASRAFDDEGQPCLPLEIISAGVLNTYLHNSYTAKALDEENNARAVLTDGGYTAVGCTNISLKSTTKEKPGKFANEYLFITEVMGMHTADPVSGDFSVGIAGIYYKDENNAFPFKEAVISGNLTHLLEGMIHTFDNRRTFGNITTADTLFDKMSVSGV